MSVRHAYPAGDKTAVSHDLGHQAVRGSLWMFSSSVIQALLHLVILMVLARLLEPSAFGVVAVSMTVIRLAEGLSRLGVDFALVQKPELSDREIATAFTFLMATSLCVVLVISLGAPVLARLFQIEELVLVLLVSAPGVAISCASEPALALLRRNMRFKQVASVTALAYAAGHGVVGIGLAAAGYGIWALVGAYLAETTIKTVGAMMIQPHRKTLQLHLPTLAGLVRFGGGMTGSQIANAVATQIDNLVVGRALGAEALGIYSRTYHLAIAPALLLGQSVHSVMFSTMARLAQHADQLGTAYRRSITAVMVVMLPAGVMMALLARELVWLCLGPSWTGAGSLLQILALGLALRVGSNLSIAAVGATGASYSAAAQQSCFALAVLVGALVGQAWGLTGVGWGVFAAVTLNYVLAARLAMRATSIGLGALASAHVPGLVFSVVVALQLWVMRDVVIGHEAPAALIVALCAASSAGTMLVALRALPVLVPRADYPAIVAAVLRIIPKPARPLARRGLGASSDDPNARPGRDGTTGDRGTRAAADALSGPAVVHVVE